MRAAGSGIGSVIGGGFGLVFVLVNSAFLPAGARLVLVGAAAACLVTIAILAFRRRGEGARTGSPFGRWYWAVVGVEVVALFAGTRILDSIHRPDLGVAWVSVVVGTHFFALGAVFGLRRFHALAALVTACGLLGFLLAALVTGPAAPVVAVVSGLVPGFLLLGFGLWAVLPGKFPVNNNKSS